MSSYHLISLVVIHSRGGNPLRTPLHSWLNPTSQVAENWHILLLFDTLTIVGILIADALAVDIHEYNLTRGYNYV
jgi:hypothetical protein